MSGNKNEIAEDKKEKERTITLRDVYDFLIYNWYWFVISCVLFIAAGVLYALSAPNYYRSSTMIFIDEEYNRSMNSDITSMMPSRMMYRQGSDVENEMHIIGSRSLMEQVVTELKANVVYEVKGRFRNEQLYGPSSPIVLTEVETLVPYRMKLDCTPGGDTYRAEITWRRAGQKRKQVSLVEGVFGEEAGFEGGRFVIDRRIGEGIPTTADYGDSFVVRVSKIRAVAETYSRRLKVDQAQKFSSIVNVSIDERVPQLAADIVNTLIKVYNQDAIDGKRETARATMRFVEDRLDTVAIELAEVDTAIERFKSSNSAVDIVAEAGLSLQSDAMYEQELLQTEIQLDMVRAMGDLLENQNDQGLLPANLGIEDAALASALDKYNEVVLRRMRLGEAGDAADNPVVRTLDTQIASMRSALKQSIHNVQSSLEIKRSSLQGQRQKIADKVSGIPSLEKETVSIRRNQEIKAALYSFLLNKREETALTMVATAPIAKVIDTALPNSRHVSPNRTMTVLVFLIIGLIVPAVAIYIIEQLRIKVGRISEVEDAVNVPIIGAIPSRESGMHGDMIVSPNSRDVITEAFRMVRTNLEFTMPEGGKVIMVTSSLPGEGKSFVSINLSLTLGIAGKRVLLVDLDLRKASLSQKISGHRQPRGLVNYLVRREDDLASLVSRNAMQNVDVLYVGVIPPNPAELLMGNRITETFDELRQMYDYVVVDTPPVGLITDTMLINRIADLTVFSVRLGHSLKRNLESIDILARRKVLRNLNVIITDIGAGHSYTRDNSSYGYGYGYGYGYERTRKIGWRTRINLLFKRIGRKK